MKMQSRLWALLLAAVLAAGLIPGTIAETADRPTVTIGLALNTNVEDYDTNAYTLYLEETFNTNIEFFLFEDINQKLPVMIASGAELPDMICHPLDNASVINWTSQGVFLPLTEYWNNPELTQHIDARLGEDKTIKENMLKSITMPDGEIYSLPSYDENVWNLRCYRMWINTAWLDKLGLKEPATLDEFTEVLRHFVNDDPNGNGIKDEIGLTGSSAWGSNPIVWIMNAFIHYNSNYTYMNVEDGKVVPSFTQDAYKAALEYLHGLYEEGLIDPLAFTQDQTQMRAVINGDTALCGFVTGASAAHFQNERKAEYRILAPVTGPEGVRFTSTDEGGSTPRVYITSSAADPELCFRIAEINYGEEARNRARLGVEGVHWTKDAEELSKWVGQYELIGYKPTIVQMEEVFGKPQNANWGDEDMPFISTQMDVMNGIAALPRTPENETTIQPVALHYLGYDCAPEEVLGSLVHTEEENEIIAATQPTIKSYVKEMTMAFITGTASLDQWDSFQQELLNMGLEDYVGVLQAAYNRKTR